MSSVHVRVAGSSDVEALSGLRRRWREDAPDPDFERRFAAWLEAEGDRRTVWIAAVDGAPVGMASLFEYRRMPGPGRPDACWGYLGNMFVLGVHRDRGVGRVLLDTVLAAAAERAYVRVVLAPSPRSVPFYLRAGFLDAGAEAGHDRLLVRSLS